jgi:transcriptional regulator with XRE-family HTH domain
LCVRTPDRVRTCEVSDNGRDDPDRRLFAEQLRAMREHAGMSRDDLGKAIGYTGSTIANIETMYRAPTPDQAARLDDALGLPGIFTRIEERLHGVPFSAGFRPFQPYEAEAVALRLFEHSLIPGLLQTEEYARAVLETHPNTTEDEVNERVTARLARQAILSRDDPPAPVVWALLDEHVLRRTVGDPKVMHNALSHLADVGRRPNVTVQVMSDVGGHAGLLGAFAIAELSTGNSIVYLETAADGQTVEVPETVRQIELRFDALRTEALTGRASLSLIERLAEEWKE